VWAPPPRRRSRRSWCSRCIRAATYRTSADVALFRASRQLGGALGVGFGTLVAAKLAGEAWLGTALFVGDAQGGAVLVPVAHVAGAVAACAAFIALRRFSNPCANRPSTGALLSHEEKEAC
jgi:hypothetical protein